MEMVKIENENSDELLYETIKCSPTTLKIEWRIEIKEL